MYCLVTVQLNINILMTFYEKYKLLYFSHHLIFKDKGNYNEFFNHWLIFIVGLQQSFHHEGEGN